MTVNFNYKVNQVFYATLSQLPSYVWSEEYQTELFSRHFKAFDILRKKPWFIGEFVWNFADFKTAQSKYH